MAWMVTLLEVGVVVLEAALIWMALRLRARTGAGPAASFPKMLAVSIVGNLVSILVSIIPPMAIVWMFR
jgi:hypothetical protein